MMKDTKTDREMLQSGIEACMAFYGNVMRSDKLFRMVRNGQLNLGPIMDWNDAARKHLQENK